MADTERVDSDSSTLSFLAKAGVLLGHLGVLVVGMGICVMFTDPLANWRQVFWWLVTFFIVVVTILYAEEQIDGSPFAAGMYTGLFAILLAPTVSFMVVVSDNAFGFREELINEVKEVQEEMGQQHEGDENV
jgi:hypothetical protein